MNKFKTIATINSVEDETWRESLFLTFDIDWAHDTVLSNAIDVVEKADVSATWFVTHETPLLERLQENPKFELGVHPNFNCLLDGDFRNGRNALEVLERVIALVPDARSVRSHSLLQSTRLLDLFKQSGLTHDVNHFIPIGTGIELRPWELSNGLCRVPFNWEDDVYLLSNNCDPISLALKKPGLKVFDFHPIHLFLNTDSLSRYERTRLLHQRPEELINYCHRGYGTCNRLIELLRAADNS